MKVKPLIRLWHCFLKINKINLDIQKKNVQSLFMTNKQTMIHNLTRRMNSNKQLAERTRLHRLDISEVNAEFQAFRKN
tara:strand:+ start:205 stop:438 length:234 start_codon:yes stop_codon:yes gene_type:complete